MVLVEVVVVGGATRVLGVEGGYDFDLVLTVGQIDQRNWNVWVGINHYRGSGVRLRDQRDGRGNNRNLLC